MKRKSEFAPSPIKWDQTIIIRPSNVHKVVQLVFFPFRKYEMFQRTFVLGEVFIIKMSQIILLPSFLFIIGDFLFQNFRLIYYLSVVKSCPLWSNQTLTVNCLFSRPYPDFNWSSVFLEYRKQRVVAFFYFCPSAWITKWGLRKLSQKQQGLSTTYL